MSSVPDDEIHDIVQRVVERTLGLTQPPVPRPPAASSPAPQMQASQVADALIPSGGKKAVAIGADHGGYELKENLKMLVEELGYTVVDCGTNDKNAVDYPDYAQAVALQVSQGRTWRGIMIDGAGIGSCMVANKIPGVRAAMCYDYATAVNSREHNDANVLTLGAGLIGVNLARQIVQTWLSTEFGGGRHASRVQKIVALEQKYLKSGS